MRSRCLHLSLPPIYLSLSCSLLTSLTLSIVILFWRQPYPLSLSLSVSGCPLPFFLRPPLHISLPIPLSLHPSASLAISLYLRPPPESSPSASPFPGAHRRNTSTMGRPKVPRNPGHMTRTPVFLWEARSTDCKVELRTSWTVSNSSCTFSWSNKKQGYLVK